MATDPRDQSSSVLPFTGPVVTLVIGPSEERLSAHLSHLESASPFFKAVFKKEWREGKEGTASLPDDELVVVNTYLHFLYTGKIASKTPESDSEPRAKGNARQSASPIIAEFNLLTKLYCFGERYQAVRFKNATIDAIIAKSQTANAQGKRYCPAGPSVDIIYKGTCAGSPHEEPHATHSFALGT